jgi:hypothetical protein
MSLRDNYGELKMWVVVVIAMLCIIIFLFVIIFPLVIIVNVGASKGEHTGLITAVESNQNILWDANLIYFKSSDETTQEEIYCIDKDLMTKAREVSSKKQIVTISFANDFWFMRWDCNGGISIVYDIK